MPRELSQFETYLVHEFVEDYVDGILSRRDMTRRVLHITGGVATTATVLTQLGVKPASAQEGTPAQRQLRLDHAAASVCSRTTPASRHQR